MTSLRHLVCGIGILFVLGNSATADENCYKFTEITACACTNTSCGTCWNDDVCDNETMIQCTMGNSISAPCFGDDCYKYRIDTVTCYIIYDCDTFPQCAGLPCRRGQAVAYSENFVNVFRQNGSCASGVP